MGLHENMTGVDILIFCFIYFFFSLYILLNFIREVSKQHSKKLLWHMVRVSY